MEQVDNFEESGKNQIGMIRMVEKRLTAMDFENNPSLKTQGFHVGQVIEIIPPQKLEPGQDPNSKTPMATDGRMYVAAGK